MQQIEQNISQYIESQFPSIFREEGPVLVQFVKAYYEWMESTGQPLFHSRRLPTYRDIDTTIDEFVTHFKLKYLPNIQFTTASSRRLFVKNALDFHRSKGSTRSVELFFKLIYGVSANIYYPGDDLFRTSDGEWIIPVYLEITPSPVSKSFVGQQITGVDSFSTGFVESFNRVRVKGKYVEVLYLSDVVGTFLAGESLRMSVLEENAPTVVGSVSSFIVIAGGAGFKKGERVGTISENGQFATGVVTQVTNVVGAANVILNRGGYGYNSTSEIIISDKTLTVRNISNNIFSKLGTLQEYYANGDLASNADVIGVSTDHTITGQLLTGSISVGQRLTQGEITGVIGKIENVGTLLEVYVQNVVSFFRSSVVASTPTGSMNVISYSALVGIANVSGPGSYTTGNAVLEVGSGITGMIQAVSQTSNAMNFDLGANTRFTNRQFANVGLDYVKPYANTRLNAVQFNLPKLPTGNVSNFDMIDMLFYETRMYGTISNSSIISLYAGSGYAKQPFILIKEDIPYNRRRSYYQLEIDRQISQFIIGEKVTTGEADRNDPNSPVFASSDAIFGYVVSAVPNESVVIERLSVDRRFYEHDDENFMIIGETSGASARIRKANTPANNDFIGLNADITAEVFTSNGLVQQISLETSGYAYIDGEQVTFFSLEERQRAGLARLGVKTHGVGAGYYAVKGGQLSDTKHLQDNNYYQEYSYEIQTSVQQDTYKQMFDQVLHVAGTKGFSSYLSVQNIDSSITVAQSTIEIEN